MLSQEQVQQYQQDGYVIIPHFLNAALRLELKTRAEEMVQDWVVTQEARQIALSQNAVFSTADNDRSGNHYFLDSAETIRCFFEAGAVDPSGNWTQSPVQCINKIGHALHELDPVFENMSHSTQLGDIAKQLGLALPVIRQSMYIFKQPRIGGVVNWHQDATYFFTTPQSVVTFWFAIEDATLENGCLWVEPKGHKGPLREVFKRQGDITHMETINDTPWPDNSSGKPVPVPAGTLICFQGTLPHYSAPNLSADSRQAYTLHVTDNATDYASDNWIQTRLLPLRGFDSE